MRPIRFRHSVFFFLENRKLIKEMPRIRLWWKYKAYFFMEDQVFFFFLLGKIIEIHTTKQAVKLLWGIPISYHWMSAVDSGLVDYLQKWPSASCSLFQQLGTLNLWPLNSTCCSTENLWLNLSPSTPVDKSLYYWVRLIASPAPSLGLWGEYWLVSPMAICNPSILPTPSPVFFVKALWSRT